MRNAVGGYMRLILLGLFFLPVGPVQASATSDAGLGEWPFIPAKDLPSAEDASRLEKPKPAPYPSQYDQVVFENPFSATTRLSPPPGQKGQGRALFLDTYHGIRLIARFRDLLPGSYRVETDGVFHEGEVAICDEAAKREDDPEAPHRTWGMVRVAANGEAAIDVLFLGISSHSSYWVSTEVAGKKDEYIRFRNREFDLLGQWITLRRISEKGEVLGKATLCGKLETHYSEAWRMQSVPNSKVWGFMLFPRDDDRRTHMKFVLRGGKAGTRYKFVIHEWEDCSDPAHGSMGPAYVPEKNKKVSYPRYPWPIVEGNLGTYRANKDGIIAGKKTYKHPLTEGSPATIWGRSIVVYALPKGKLSATNSPVPVACGKVYEGDAENEP
jgi:hypothetical protein